jgi:hypothetical protein
VSRKRALLSTAFEHSNGHWVWYPNALSRGIQVSRDEREIYLRFDPIGFRRAIAGRAPTWPRRPYWSNLGRLLVALFSGRDPKGEGN